MDTADPYIRKWLATSMGTPGPGGTRLAGAPGATCGLTVERGTASAEHRAAWERDRYALQDDPLITRLAGVTQVLPPTREAFTHASRLDHSREVSVIAAQIAAELNLDEHLAAASGLAHDCGHLPFGHAGERQVQDVLGCNSSHAEHGAMALRKRGYSEELVSAVASHSWSSRIDCRTPEAEVLRWADRIAYVTRDFADAVDCGLISEADQKTEVVDVLGDALDLQRKTLIRSVVTASSRIGRVSMDAGIASALGKFRMHNNCLIYQHPEIRYHNDVARSAITSTINVLQRQLLSDDDIIATLIGMTDQEVTALADG